MNGQRREDEMAVNVGNTETLRKLKQIDQRLDDVTRRVKALERLRAEVDDLRRTLGDLKLEVEEFREAD